MSTMRIEYGYDGRNEFFCKFYTHFIKIIYDNRKLLSSIRLSTLITIINAQFLVYEPLKDLPPNTNTKKVIISGR